MTKIAVLIKRRRGDYVVDATLHDRLAHANQTEVAQFGHRSPLWKWVPAKWSPVDIHWHWDWKLVVAGHGAGLQIWALDCPDAQRRGLPLTQGLVMFQFGSSPLGTGEIVAHINTLGAAPHNRRFGWRRMAWPGQYKGVKLLLLKSAQWEAVRIGHSGKIGLFAIPRTEAFYARLGLKKYKNITDGHGDVYFEGFLA